MVVTINYLPYQFNNGKRRKNGYKARKNLIQVEIQIPVQKDQDQDLQHYHYQDGISRQECKHFTTYDLNELIKIKHVNDSDIRYKQLSFGTVSLICEFKLNGRKRGSMGGQGKKTYQNIEKNPTGIIWQNLRKVPCIPSRQVKHTGKLIYAS